MKIASEELDGALAYAIKRYRDVLPASWRGNRPRRGVWPQIGAQFELKAAVARELAGAPEPRNRFAYIVAALKNAMIDAKREESEDGFKGRREGRSKAHRAGLAGFSDLHAPVLREAPEARLGWLAPDPLAAAARAQLEEHVRAWRDGYSKPTARKHLQAGPRPDDFIIEVPYWPNLWREPPNACHLVNWSYRVGGYPGFREDRKGQALFDLLEPLPLCEPYDAEARRRRSWDWRPSGRGQRKPFSADWSLAADPAVGPRLERYKVPASAPVWRYLPPYFRHYTRASDVASRLSCAWLGKLNWSPERKPVGVAWDKLPLQPQDAPTPWPVGPPIPADLPRQIDRRARGGLGRWWGSWTAGDGWKRPPVWEPPEAGTLTPETAHLYSPPDYDRAPARGYDPYSPTRRPIAAMISGAALAAWRAERDARRANRKLNPVP